MLPFSVCEWPCVFSTHHSHTQRSASCLGKQWKRGLFWYNHLLSPVPPTCTMAPERTEVNTVSSQPVVPGEDHRSQIPAGSCGYGKREEHQEKAVHSRVTHRPCPLCTGHMDRLHLCFKAISKCFHKQTLSIQAVRCVLSCQCPEQNVLKTYKIHYGIAIACLHSWHI